MALVNEWTRFALLAGYVAISVAGMVLIKGADTIWSAKGLTGFALYLAGFLVWIGVILRVMPLSQAFPMAAGALMLGTQLTGWLVLKERVGLPQVTGALLIIAGVILVGFTTSANN